MTKKSKNVRDSIPKQAGAVDEVVPERARKREHKPWAERNIQYFERAVSKIALVSSQNRSIDTADATSAIATLLIQLADVDVDYVPPSGASSTLTRGDKVYIRQQSRDGLAPMLQAPMKVHETWTVAAVNGRVALITNGPDAVPVKTSILTK
jgi:hypothetical protein